MANIPPLDVKICGLTTPKAVVAALDGGASHIGFIFFEKSPRHIELEHAALLRSYATDRAQVVAVTVDADNNSLDEIVEKINPDMLQLHGKEIPKRVGEIKQRYGLSVMKAFAVRNAEDLKKSGDYASIADRILFDAKPAAGSELPGGNGVSFDWTLLRDFDAKLPIMLSGGLDQANIAEAVAIAQPDGVDISSGVETSPGIKDSSLIANFMQEVSGLPVRMSSRVSRAKRPDR